MGYPDDPQPLQATFCGSVIAIDFSQKIENIGLPKDCYARGEKILTGDLSWKVISWNPPTSKIIRKK